MTACRVAVVAAALVCFLGVLFLTVRPMSDELTPQERTARIMGLHRELMATLPTESSSLYLTREQIAKREAQAKEYGAELHALARHEDLTIWEPGPSGSARVTQCPEKPGRKASRRKPT